MLLNSFKNQYLCDLATIKIEVIAPSCHLRPPPPVDCLFLKHKAFYISPVSSKETHDFFAIAVQGRLTTCLDAPPHAFSSRPQLRCQAAYI